MAEDHLVRVAVEVIEVQEADDVVQDLVVQQDPTQHGPLGLEVLGRKMITQRAASGLGNRRVSVAVDSAFAVTEARCWKG